MSFSYVPPDDSISCPPINPRTTLLPLQPPPITPDVYPTLPDSNRSHSFASHYNVSTHLFPAAFPRAPSKILDLPPPGVSVSKARIRETVEYLSARKEAQERGGDIGQSRKDILWTVANRYVRKAGAPSLTGPPLTLVMLHGIGAHKEIWEPILFRLLSNADRAFSPLNVHEIWAVDCVQHGDSSLLNEGLLPDIFDCAELSRDLTNFVLYYLPSSPLEAVPTNLPRLPESVAQRRQGQGFAPNRKVVGIGHSVGACSFVYPAFAHPNLFDSLVMIESMTIPESIRSVDAHRRFEALCLGRKGAWASRQEAERAITTGAYYRTWAPSAVQAYLAHALVPTVGGGWRLKTHPWHEAVMLFERLVVYETWELLASLPRSLPLHWVWGGTSMRSGGSAIQAQTSWRRRGNAGADSNVCLEGVGHLLPQEAPEKLGDCLFRFLDKQYGTRLSIDAYEAKSKL